MKLILLIILTILFCSCTSIISHKKNKIVNPLNNEVIYMKYCEYDNGHEATFISLDSIFAEVDEISHLENNPVDEFIAYYDNPHFYYKLTNDTLIVCCYGLFEIPKNHHKFKTEIKMINMDIVGWSKMQSEFKELGYTVFPHCP